MEKDLKQISKELQGASKMHKGQAEKIDSLLERKDNKSIAKMLKKSKNSASCSPSKMNDYSPVNLTFQPKNLNQHLSDKPNYGSTSSETKESESEEVKDGDPVISPKEKSLTPKQEMKNTINSAKLDGLSAAPMFGDDKKKADRQEKREILKGDRESYREDHPNPLKRIFGKHRAKLTDKINK